MQKQREKAWGILPCDLWHGRHMLSCLFSTATVLYEIDLAFCASYEDGTSTSRELHQAYETYPGYKPGIQKATKWQVWKYLAVMKSSRGAKRWHYLELHRLYYSHPSAVKLSTWISSYCFRWSKMTQPYHRWCQGSNSPPIWSIRSRKLQGDSVPFKPNLQMWTTFSI